ncbi:MAG: glycosyltransferase [Candidatus Omnitrophota bacterium]|nr:MAG: glycosyltransferase [Candidatus Omnitrophota bacterium]
MNPFTGGCHYSAGCKRYQTGCGWCPQLGPKHQDDLSRRIFKRKEKAYKGCNIHIVTLSKWFDDCVRKSSLFKNFPTSIIPHGIPHDIFKKRDRCFSRDRLNLPQDKTLILFGTDYKTERKGFKYLQEALRLLKNKIDPSTIALVIFGPKQDLDRLSKDVRFPLYELGYIQDEALLSAAYSGCDMFVIPSIEEAFGLTCLEAMACGTPVVGFNTGGILDMVISHKTGFLAELKNTEGLADKIEYMITHPEEREEMGLNARKLVEQEYILQIQAKRYLKLYETMLSASRSP